MDSVTVINNLKSLLGSNLTDPLSGQRTGSYIFGPDQELNFARYTPKVQINFDTLENVDRSFGDSFERQKAQTIWICFYNKRGDKYTSGANTYINRDYTLYFLEQIEDAIVDNATTHALHGIDIGQVDKILYNPEHQVYVGILPVTFGWRKQ